MKGMLQAMAAVTGLGALLTLGACGGGGGGGGESVLTGVFEDAPVNGLYYETWTDNGTRLLERGYTAFDGSQDGTFVARKDARVDFYLGHASGGVKLGSVTLASGVGQRDGFGRVRVGPVELVSQAVNASVAANDTRVINLGALFTALDSDNRTEVMAVNGTVQDAFARVALNSLNPSQARVDFNGTNVTDFSSRSVGDRGETLSGVVRSVNGNVGFDAVSTEAVRVHLAWTLASRYVGTYQGPWSLVTAGGETLGTWSVAVTPTQGGQTALASGRFDVTGGGFATVTGTVSAAGVMALTNWQSANTTLMAQMARFATLNIDPVGAVGCGSCASGNATSGNATLTGALVVNGEG
ncbi:MAG: hypothetical protein H7831_02335 [Magnetococcus sp. WYHC-3]